VITSKYIIDISEEWSKSAHTPGGGVCDIYENPGSSDVKELYQNIKGSDKLVRYITDARVSKVYVWNASLNIHDSVRREYGLGDSGQPLRTPYVIEGFGKISGSRIVSVSRDLEGTIAKLKSGLKFLLDWEISKRLDPDVVKNFLSHTSYLLERFSGTFKFKWDFLGRHIAGDDVILKNLYIDYQDFLKRMKKFGYS